MKAVTSAQLSARNRRPGSPACRFPAGHRRGGPTARFPPERGWPCRYPRERTGDVVVGVCFSGLHIAKEPYQTAEETSHIAKETSAAAEDVFLSLSVYVCIYTCMHTYTRIHVNTYICIVYIPIYIPIYVSIFTYIYIYRRTNWRCCCGRLPPRRQV